MHQHSRAFDATDPDASQALEDALPIVEELLLEKSKPEPRSAELRAAWLAQQAEIRSRLSGPADRADMSIEGLEEIAEAQIRRVGGGRTKAAPFTATPAPDLSFNDLANALATKQAERSIAIEEGRELLVKHSRVAGRVIALGREIRSIERRLHQRGQVLA